MLRPIGRATRSANCKPHELVFLSAKIISKGSLPQWLSPSHTRLNSNLELTEKELDCFSPPHLKLELLSLILNQFMRF